MVNEDVRVLVVGKTSFIGSEFVSAGFPGISVKAISHREIPAVAQNERFDAVLNCALDPAFKSGGYEIGHDADLAAAKLAVRTGAHYVMLSTRRVYASSAQLRRIGEQEQPAPDTHYGRNKLESEQRVTELLGERCTILRISNVFGYEPGRSTFFGIAVTSLRREQRVILDVSPFVVRDFLPVDVLCQTLAAVIKARPGGVFNLGAGFGVPIGQIALWLLEGYGSGELVVNCPGERDAFILDVSKLHQLVPGCPSVSALESVVKAIGSTAKDAQHSTVTSFGKKTRDA